MEHLWNICFHDSKGADYRWLPSVPFLVYGERYDSVFLLPCTLLDKTNIFQKCRKFVRNAVFYCGIRFVMKRTSIVTVGRLPSKHLPVQSQQ